MKTPTIGRLRLLLGLSGGTYSPRDSVRHNLPPGSRVCDGSRSWTIGRIRSATVMHDGIVGGGVLPVTQVSLALAKKAA